MKIRYGFIANSSSSSFLVVSHDGKYDFNQVDELRVPQTFGGEVEFGRQCVDYKDFGSKLNFALMLAKYWDNLKQRPDFEKCLEYDYDQYWKSKGKDFIGNLNNLVQMVKNVVLDYTAAKKLEIYLDMDQWYLRGEIQEPRDDWGNGFLQNEEDYYESSYIDHGSLPGERPRNLEIFRDHDTLRDFLFGVNSFVANRGDEYEPPICKIGPHDEPTLNKKDFGHRNIKVRSE
jgi:hypothetical protein